MTDHYDIFVLEVSGSILWIGTAPTFEDAKKRLLQPPVPAQTRYIILDQGTGEKHIIETTETLMRPADHEPELLDASKA